MNEPCVVISEKGKPFLEKGQMWMYSNNVIRTDSSCEDGEPVRIVDEEGTFIAKGFYSAVSHVTVRILTRDEDEVIDRAFFRRRIRAAADYRRTAERENLTCCRVVFSEADLLPGLVCDRYGAVLVIQISCAGFEKRKDMICELLEEELSKDAPVEAVYIRNDIPSRTKEGLDQYTGFWNEKTYECPVIVEENGLKLDVDYIDGQKTGYFLDQKTNRMLVRRMAKGHKVLDCFTHTGGFALNAALGGAAEVTAVDVSGLALEAGLANAKLNHLEERMRFVQADVFEYLDTLEKGQFDFIILDPPAFTKSRKTVYKAYNGYKRINAQAMRALKGGGWLATCSCSRYMETGLFEQMLKEAAFEAGVILRQVSVTQQNADHPILWLMEETSYLKFYIFQIL
ncbi:MAG: class I SAM-dependent rRNA methyltransferase [Solobacterium sp.]|nr:class I SAM-dependent rRNA methyltransferase [Solobacterium sp.]